ncbi:tetratricopeptide repeat protein, partial [bacterium]|nr:tetratricopeptide repeat protein [bacterium]
KRHKPSEPNVNKMDITESAIESFLSKITPKRGRGACDSEAIRTNFIKRATKMAGTSEGSSDKASIATKDKKSTAGKKDAQEASIESLFQKALSAYKAMEYEDALILFKKLLKRDPNRKQFYPMLGTTFFQNGMLSEAIEVFQALKSIEPVDPSVYENLGYIYCAAGNFEAAGREWQVAQMQSNGKLCLTLKLNRTAQQFTGDAPQGKRQELIIDGIKYYRKKNYALAIRAFKLASLLLPESTSYILLGNAYFRNDMIPESTRAYENAISFDGNNVFAFESLGQVYSRQGAIDQAIKTWEKILQIQPKRNDIVKRIDDLITRNK